MHAKRQRSGRRLSRCCLRLRRGSRRLSELELAEHSVVTARREARSRKVTVTEASAPGRCFCTHRRSVCACLPWRGPFESRALLRNAFMYSAAISSCAKGSAWQVAIWLQLGCKFLKFLKPSNRELLRRARGRGEGQFLPLLVRLSTMQLSRLEAYKRLRL